jgi:hypothetical protein
LLNPAGIEQIKASRKARLDMTSGKLTKESVGNNGPDFSEVTYFLKADHKDDFFALIRGVDRYGIPSDSAERWIESISNRPEDKSDFALSAGKSTGLMVTYDLRYDRPDREHELQKERNKELWITTTSSLSRSGFCRAFPAFS